MPSVSRKLTDEEVEAIAQRAAEIVLASDELAALVRHATTRHRRRPGEAAARAQASAERVALRKQEAIRQQDARLEVERERADRLIELWGEGVPREQIARDLGFTRRGFSAEVSRLRLEGVELAYREGVD